MTTSQKVRNALILLGIFGFLTIPAFAATKEFAETYTLPSGSEVKNNLYVGAGTAVVSGSVTGDVVVGAGDATVSGAVAADALVAGGTVDILGSVAGDARIFGGRVSVADVVGGDAVLLGGMVSVLSDARIGGDALIFGGKVILLGDVGGNVFAAGKDIFIDGKVVGNLRIYSAGRVRIGANAIIGGDVTYRADQEAQVHPGAVIKGKLSHDYSAPLFSASDLRGFFAGVFGFMFVARLIILIVSALFFVLVFRRISGSLMHVAVPDFWKMSLIGFIVFATVPLASLILLVTLFGSLIPIRMFVAEQAWFISGQRKPEVFLRDFTKIWDDFTNPGDTVTVAYGYRWRKHFGRDQLGLLIELLEKEPSSRHGVIVTWDPAQDGLSLFKKKNVPCPYTFTINIIGGRLHLHNIIRSNDVILGTPADVGGFALLAHILAQRLGVKPGIYSHSISNAHIYDIHYFAAEEIMKRKNTHEKITVALPSNAFERAEKMDKKLVEEICENLSSQYQPMESIKGIKIVL